MLAKRFQNLEFGNPDLKFQLLLDKPLILSTLEDYLTATFPEDTYAIYKVLTVIVVQLASFNHWSRLNGTTGNCIMMMSFTC